MPFILDYRCPTEAIEKLQKLDDVHYFNAGKIVYPAISGHPDIFMVKIGSKTVIAPNIPPDTFEYLKSLNLELTEGKVSVGFRYPQTAQYNVFTDDNIAVLSSHTDVVIRDLCSDLDIIEVKQGYIACNLTKIGKSYICSDRGIEKAMLERSLPCFYTDPKSIILPGAGNGFIGGTLGHFGEKVLFCGNKNNPIANLLEEICRREDKELVFLCNSGIYDLGGIISY